MKQRLLIIFSLIIVVSVGYGVFRQLRTTTPVTTPVATTTDVVHCSNDAKLCPNGTTVLRSGSQCEFAACPSVYGEVSAWQATKDKKSGVAFKYPLTLSNSDYLTAREWPPQFTVTKEAYACVATAATSTASSFTREETFNGNTYCVTERKEGAAGSTYTEYKVAFAKEEKLLTMSFTVQTVQCLNYDGSQQSVCQSAQAAFKVEELVDTIAGTIKL